MMSPGIEYALQKQFNSLFKPPYVSIIEQLEYDLKKMKRDNINLTFHLICCYIAIVFLLCFTFYLLQTK